VTTTDTLAPRSPAVPGHAVEVDLLMVGAGPAGLYATYYAGFRGLRTAVIDSLPEPGGQVTALYPEKMIYDVAGFPEVVRSSAVWSSRPPVSTRCTSWVSAPRR
jgi:NADPH-dependent 2,4-dienoyl-CoA reductase/sulfur reductase-like enzyme